MQHFAQKSDATFGEKTYGKPYADMVQWQVSTEGTTKKKNGPAAKPMAESVGSTET